MAGTIPVEVYLFPVRWNQNEKEKLWKETAGMVLALAVSMTLVPVMGQREVQAAKILDAWDGETTEVPKTDENGTYQISNGAELAWFAKKVNDGASSINGELTDKIYLGDGTSQNKWLMVGDTAEHAIKEHLTEMDIRYTF